MDTITQRNRKSSQPTEFLDDFESTGGIASRKFDSAVECETTPSSSNIVWNTRFAFAFGGLVVL